MSTLPGIYLKGWFGQEAWNGLKPDEKQSNWREQLVKNIVNVYRPLFDARNRANVPGRPMSNCQWLAHGQGFMEMGPDRQQCFVVDVQAFATVLDELLKPLPSITQRDCFELIHQAFDRAIRGRKPSENGGGRSPLIFYHIHNPDSMEMANFLRYYPKAKQLWIVRNPVQAMESWMVNAAWIEEELISLKESLDFSAEEIAIQEQQFKLTAWNKMAGNATTMLLQLQSPFTRQLEARGVRLEDVKRHPKIIMPKLAAWMGIGDDPALYKTSFCDLQYWGPASRMSGAITGFDTRSIDNKIGNLLGLRDIMIFETLFWPMASQYGYTALDESGFRRQLAEIRPWLDDPFEFEKELYDKLPDHTQPLQELGPYKQLHRTVVLAWGLLERNGTYGGIPQPLLLD